MTAPVPQPAAEQVALATDAAGATVVAAEVSPTQVRRPWRSTVRTVFQAFVMLCFLAPAIYSAATQHSPELATGYVAGGLGLAGAVTRVMALPGVERFLRRFVPFLAAAPKPGGRRAKHKAGD